MLIEFPMSHFGKAFEKDYEMHGAQFTVRVLNVGPTDLGPTWLFMLLVKGRQIEGGPYHPRYDRELTDENVANHLASFWGHTKMVADAWELEGSPEWELDRIVEKCAAFMHGYFLSDHEENTDYDIVRQFMDEDEWVVVLRPNYMPKRLVEFYKKIDREDIQINSYIEIDELSVKF